MKKCVLLYGFNKFQTEQVKKAFVMLNFEVRVVDESEYGYKIGELIGEFERTTPEENCEIPGKMAVVSGVAEGEIANIFKVLVDATGNLAYHKAIVTDTNINWTSARLYVEVDREYKELRRRNRFKR